VRRSGDEVGVLDRIDVDAGGDQAGDVSDVGDVDRVDCVGDVGEAGEVELPRIGRRPGDDQIGIELAGRLLGRVVVDVAGLGVDLVLFDLVVLAREVHVVAVAQVAAVGEVQERILSPGSRTLKYTAMFACVPLWG